MSDILQKFVQLIQNDQCLYNNTLQEYSRKDVTDKAWSAIAKEMQWTVADCKEKWKNIRNGFVRSLKPSSSSTSSKGKKPYYLHETMQFVMPYIRPLQNLEHTGNISLSDTELTTQHDETEFQCLSTGNVFERNTEYEHTSSEPSAKRKRISESPSILADKKQKKKKHIKDKEEISNKDALENVTEKKETKPNDYRQMFLLSLLPDVENLSERNLRQFKIKSLILLEQLLTEQEQVTQQYYDCSQVNDYDMALQRDADGSRCSSESCVKNITPSPVDVKPSTSPNVLY